MFKSVIDFHRILLHFFQSVVFLGRSPDRLFFASARDRGGPNRSSCFFLYSYSVNNFNCILVCQASSWPGLVSFRRRLLRSTCLPSCLRSFGWWSLWPHWVFRFHPSDISLDSTRHHLLGRNRRKKRFCARQQPRAGLLYYFPRIRVVFLSVFTFCICFSFFHTSQSFDDDGCAPSQFTHFGGLLMLMLQGTFRAHCCGTASLGSMSVLLTLKTT